MYEICRNVILSERFELTDMLKKIDALWIQGDISEDQRTELTGLARQRFAPDAGYASGEERLLSVEKRVSALEKEIREIKGTDIPEEDEYPQWSKPTHAGNAYYTGMKMTYTDGVRYVCIAPEGYAVVYGPDILPDMWEGKEI